MQINPIWIRVRLPPIWSTGGGQNYPTALKTRWKWSNYYVILKFVRKKYFYYLWRHYEVMIMLATEFAFNLWNAFTKFYNMIFRMDIWVPDLEIRKKRNYSWGVHTFLKNDLFSKCCLKINPLFSVTWSKTECDMRNYLFTFYFGLKLIQSVHIFLFGQNSSFTADYHVYPI